MTNYPSSYQEPPLQEDYYQSIVDKLQAENAELMKERDELKARIAGGVRVEASVINHNSPNLVCASNEDNEKYYNATLILDEGVTL